MRDSVSLEIEKWLQTVRTQWMYQLTYKADLIFQFLGPPFVFFGIQYNVWTALFSAKPDGVISSYTLHAMLQYQAMLLIVRLLTQVYTGRNLALDIRYGRITPYLFFPFSFFKYHMSGWLALMILQTLVVAATAVVFALGGILNVVPTSLLFGLSYAIVLSLFWFILQFLLGITAFWIEETWVFRVAFDLLVTFFGGGIVPLALFPEWVTTLLLWTPFPYLLGVPAEIFLGTYQGSVIIPFLILGAWTALAGVAVRFTWNSGLKHYSAAGI